MSGERPKSAHIDGPELRLREIEIRMDHTENRLDQGAELHQQVMRCLEANTAAICALEASTKGVVAAYTDVQAAARVGTALQKLAVWLLKFGGALAFMGWSLNRILEAWKHTPGP